jgi:predicted DNA-binding transcriptional regulator YafY
MQSGYGIFGGAVRGWAKLKFSPGRARWVKQEEWHEAQKGRELADGSYILEIPYSDERELLGDILRFGSDVQVISPNSLRNQVLTELKNSSAAYQSGISLGSDLTP